MNFVLLQTVFFRLAAYHAFHELGNRSEGITTDDVEAVASYRAERARYNERFRTRRSTTARRSDGAPTTNWLMSRTAASDPKEPGCPAVVRPFWNMLARRGTSINASEMVMMNAVTDGRFPSYALDGNGLATRLGPENFRVRAGPFLARNPQRGQDMPVHVLEEDVEHFVVHGRLGSEEPAVPAEEGETGSTPSETTVEQPDPMKVCGRDAAPPDKSVESEEATEQPDTATGGADEGKGAELPELKKDEGRPPDKQPNPVGRPTEETEIEAAYKELRNADAIDYDAPKARLYDPIREKVRERKGAPDLRQGLGDEAIRKVIRKPFEKDKKNKRSASP